MPSVNPTWCHELGSNPLPQNFYLFVALCHFQHCTGHITTSGFVGTGHQYIQLVKVLYCKLLTIGKATTDFPIWVWGLNRKHQRWEAGVLPLCTLHPPPSQKTVAPGYQMPRLLTTPSLMSFGLCIPSNIMVFINR